MNVVPAIAERLALSGQTLSVAESCTGGMIAHLLTSVSGASRYFVGGVVAYSPALKESLLGVRPETISDYGIVSAEVASAMALGVRKLTGSTYSVATTGFADGPGDSHEPGGTVWVASAGPAGLAIVQRFRFCRDRSENISLFAESALDVLMKTL